ncbi:MAG: efflux RND transporter permease subunit [Alphaproteobacteria bacterium]|nr:efflux RND transporter permease subunit [Alphaproteobacteria bacterium]MCL2505891.1 efflux RND transporter permease subunit [Alphaproteobacteria bacterium]
MYFTDIFVKRPVLATVVSLMILVIGIKAALTLPVLQYPQTQNAIITVTTVYYGADSATVAGFITTPLEQAIAQANGIDYMTSSSTNGTSTIVANLRLNYDPLKTLTEINSNITKVRNQIPTAAQQSVLSISIGSTLNAMYISFKSDILRRNEITDYLVRVIQPKLQAVEGVQAANILGAQNFAIRAWLDPQKLAAYGLTATDVSNALQANNYISGLGNTKGQMVQITLNASTDISTLEEFRDLIISQRDGAIIRLKHVANVTLGADDYDSNFMFDGQNSVSMGIQTVPSANVLSIVENIRKIYPEIQAQLPEGMEVEIAYDSTKFIKSSIEEVQDTLIEAVLIVTLVVFVFLGVPRSVIVPLIAIPLSLVGAFIFMAALGFSINLLTLLALVLAIGLVVDDAIIVVENVTRHIEEGKSPYEAAMLSGRELLGPIIAMTIVLVAVYVPIGFQGGLTGALFTEFAWTLVGAVVISAIVALTLTPMLCSRLFKPHDPNAGGFEEKIVKFLDDAFARLHNKYRNLLSSSLNYLGVTIVFVVLILCSIYFLYTLSAQELAPQEDQGIVIASSTFSPTATLQQKLMYSREAYRKLATLPEKQFVFQVNAPGFDITGLVLTPWNERKRTASQIQPVVQKELDSIAGFKAASFQPASLPGSSGLPIAFVITSTQPLEQMYDVVMNFMNEVSKTGLFVYYDQDLKVDFPQSTVIIDRDKASGLGLSMLDIGGALSSMLGGGYVNYFAMDGRSYRVIPQVMQESRLVESDLYNYYINNAYGQPVALSTFAAIETNTIPRARNHFQQLNAATISAVMMPGVSMGEGLATMQEIAKRSLPDGYDIDYAGQSRQFMNESSGFIGTFVLALLIVFLVLSAQYESFRDPFIILISVPMSIAGALFFIALCSTNIAVVNAMPAPLSAFMKIIGLGAMGNASINIYTQVGLVTLMGLISKHGILITEFANKQQEAGKSKKDAICEAAAIRLRPILMTTGAMVLGVVPMLMATGAGAMSRINLGLVIATGLFVGTLFTLFVVPAMYMLIGADHHKRKM